MVNALIDVKDEATPPVVVTAPIVVASQIDPIKMEEIQIDRLKWANRRKFAWVSLYAIILLTFLMVIIALLHPPGFDKLISGTELFTWLVGFISIPIFTYSGGTISQTITEAVTKGKIK